jgi:hypothetical protein
MNNKIDCSNCGTSNIFFRLNCTNCNAIIRDKVVNIDLWSILWKLIESPIPAFTQIIQAENKNFVVFLSFAAGIKLFLHTFFLSSVLNYNAGFEKQIVLNLLLLLGYFLIFIFLYAFIILRINKNLNIEGRYRDYYSLLIYGLIPLVFSFMFLTPVEYALFGKHWFISNPAPFSIKPMAAYVLLVLEILLSLWSLILIGLALFLQTNKLGLTITEAIIFFLGISAIVFFLPYLPF